MELDAYLTFLRADLDTIAATPIDGLGEAVGACPGWTVSDLLAHHTGVLRFVTAQLLAAPGSDMVKFDPLDDDEPILDAFATASTGLLAALERTDPTEHRPNWAGAATAAFWWRRMAHEAAIHRFDAQAALGRAEPIDPALAIDGVDEFCQVFLAHAKRRRILGSGETVHLHATDDGVADGTIPGGEWLFTFTDEGVAIDYAHGKGDMAARGSANDLYLFVWNRRPVDLVTFGDTDVQAWWPAHVAI